MNRELILIGGGGHCKASIEVIEAAGTFKIAGIVDLREKLHEKVLGYEIIASDEDLPLLAKEYTNFLITIGQVGIPTRRRELFALLKGLQVNLPTIISPDARVSSQARVGDGTIIFNGAVVQPEVKIGNNCIINVHAVIGHNSVIGNHCHIALGGVIAGDCTIGEGVFIGANGTVVNGARIAHNTVVAPGAIIMKTIDVSGIYLGNPARKIG